MLNRILLISALLMFLIPGCDTLGGGIKSTGLKPGLNYMQPIKWQLTYRYRIQEVQPTVPYLRERKWSIDPSVPTVGDGTIEAWFAVPREGEELRGVKLLNATPPPTSREMDLDNDCDLIYYDFTPDGNLPKEVQASIQIEFITFERYAYWEGMPEVEYDKSSEFYKRYTKQESPIVWNKEMQKDAKDMVPENPNDYVRTALGAYNHVVCNYTYDYDQSEAVQFRGFQAMLDATRCYKNKLGVCDEFANVACSMLRINGIPCRPVAGIVHPISVGEDKLYMTAAAHAWAEFYMPEVGWVPIDPTWGQADPNQLIEPYYSMTGSLRKIPQVDYYFGKTDPYRIPLFKDWDVKLNPPPKTPGASAVEPWFVGCTERNSGILDMIHGWDGAEGKRAKG